MWVNENDAQKKTRKKKKIEKVWKSIAFYVNTYSNHIIVCIDQNLLYNS